MRKALIRLLGGDLSPPSKVPPGLAAIPPAVASAAIAPASLKEQSERLFAYAELLSQQGCSDLAAPIYRQACLNLRALCGLAGAANPSPQPVLPQPGSASAAPAGLATPGGQAGPSAPAPPRPQLQMQTLQSLKERLNAETAAEVEQHLLELLRQGQRDDEITHLLGLALLLQRRREDAERWFRETVTINPRHDRALVNLGGLCLASGRTEEAVPWLSRAVELCDPGSSESLAALTNLSLAHQKLGRPMDAARLALRIFRIKPDHLRPESLAATAETLEEMGEEDAAIELLRHLRQRGGGSEQIRQLAHLLERRGDFQEAALVYRDLLSQPESSSSVLAMERPDGGDAVQAPAPPT